MVMAAPLTAAAVLMTLGGLIGHVSILLPLSLVFWVLALPVVAAAIGLSMWEKRNSKPPLTPLEREAAETEKFLIGHMRVHRLNRCMAKPVAILLDEAARSWWRIRCAPDASGAYGEAVLRAKTAADEAMLEVMVNVRPLVREPSVSNWRDVVAEVAQWAGVEVVSGEAVTPSELAPARRVVEDLRDLAERLESLARANGQTFEPRLTNRLDEALSELRNLQDAEEELRQNLRGR